MIFILYLPFIWNNVMLLLPLIINTIINVITYFKHICTYKVQLVVYHLIFQKLGK